MKKIISILLALISVLSLFAVTASARVLGDVNGDGVANSVDALQILNYVVGNPSTINEKYADVDGSGAINSSDALVILTISVGNYKEPTNVDLKSEIVTPILTSGQYTLSMNIIQKDDSGALVKTPLTMMVDGKNICVATTVTSDGITLNMRMLIKNGQATVLLPDYRVAVAIPDEYLDGLDFGSIDFGNLNFSEGQTFVKSKYTTVSGKKYTVDVYKDSDGSFSEYYFLDGSWTKLDSIAADGTTVTASKEITQCKKGVDSSYFSTKGYWETDLETLMGLLGGLS